MREAGNLLDASTVCAHLARRGLLDGREPAEVSELGGGVSNVTLGVRAGEQRFVVKQALARLAVADDWPAKPERAMTEAAALRWAAGLTPELVPEVLDVDAATCTIVISAAPPGWRNWKEQLLSGEVDADLGYRLGTTLAGWQSDVKANRLAAERFADREAFEQLRVDAYYRTVARRRPELAACVLTQLAAMLARRTAFTHGDFSPKNVLTGPDGFWVIDFEVAHYGDPAFDVAFLVNHLLLKSVHRPELRAAYRGAAQAFLAGYAARAALPGGGRHIGGQLACLLLARVHGKSPAEYLSPTDRAVASRLGEQLLRDGVDDPLEAWPMLDSQLPGRATTR